MNRCIKKSLVLILLTFLPVFFSQAQVGSVLQVVSYECSDGIDNDGDGQVDWPADLGCTDASDNTENSDTFACGDTIDNDGDGLIDWPADPGCNTVNDNDETDVVSGGSGGGGGGSSRSGGNRRQSNIIVTGLSQPGAVVYLLDRGTLLKKVTSGTDAQFRFDINLEQGNHIFSFYSIDQAGVRSNTVTIPDEIDTADARLSGVFIPPTTSVGVKKGDGDDVSIFGETVPNARVTMEISLGGQVVFTRLVLSGSDGKFSQLLVNDLFVVDNGEYGVKAKAFANESTQSGFGRFISFTLDEVITANSDVGGCGLRADLNDDCRVNLVDFSIGAYWWRKSLSPGFSAIERDKLNGDDKMNLQDFSIMAYYWTG